MASTEGEIRAFIKAEQRKGTPDAKIVIGMTKLSGRAIAAVGANLGN